MRCSAVAAGRLSRGSPLTSPTPAALASKRTTPLATAVNVQVKVPLAPCAKSRLAGNGPLIVLSGHVDGDNNIGWGRPDSDFYSISSEDTALALDALFANYDTVWQLRGYDTVNDPHGFIRTWLDNHGEATIDQVFPGQTFVRVQAWRTTQAERSDVSANIEASDAIYTNGIDFKGFKVMPAELESGRPLRLALYWQPSTSVDQSFKVFNHLLSADGEVVAQADGLPLHGTHPTDHWQPGEIVESSFALQVPENLPPGDYTLITGFYDESDGARLLLADGEDKVLLATFTLPDA